MRCIQSSVAKGVLSKTYLKTTALITLIFRQKLSTNRYTIPIAKWVFGECMAVTAYIPVSTDGQNLVKNKLISWQLRMTIRRGRFIGLKREQVVASPSTIVLLLRSLSKLYMPIL